jgi:gamma-glutamylputrescine oxidase
MLSIWEKLSFTNYDYVIIGSGIVGLNIAICLKNKYPNSSVIILERGLLPTGASTKNAGFACMGSVTELLDDIQKNGIDAMVQLFELRMKGLERTISMLGEKSIGYIQNGSYELLENTNKWALDKVDYLNQALRASTKNKDAFTINKNIINENKFNNEKLFGAIQNNLEGELNTGMLIKSLMHKAQSLHVQIMTGATLISYTETTNCVELNINDNLKIIASQLIFATNAFTTNFLPTLDIEAGRGQVLITKPIANMPFKGIYHMDSGYYYFREFNNCVLLGGGRNLDFKTENTTDLGENTMILENLKTILKQIILPNTPHEMDYNWSGIMAFGQTKKPIVQQHSEKIYLCVRMGGMGVALGSEVANQLVEEIMQ